MLQPLSRRTDPNIIIGLQTSDDAAVYKLSDELAIVQTVDFFPPVVDDPYTYGAIAAANSMSDVFAMGADVRFALNVAAFPDNLSLDILSSIFEGAADKAAEAGIIVAGGHTITDVEPKYGLIVTGTIHPDQVLTKARAQPGDILYLTKPLGTGAITTAMKQEAADDSDGLASIRTMSALNQTAGRIARISGAHACTDVTGFGLLGHASEVAINSGVAIEFDRAAIPFLPGAERYAREGHLPGGLERNREYFEQHSKCGVSFSPETTQTEIDLLYDPETSGGLLIAIGPQNTMDFESAFSCAGHDLWRIGSIQTGRGISIR